MLEDLTEVDPIKKENNLTIQHFLEKILKALYVQDNQNQLPPKHTIW